jgi:non-ribosomal peptide synthase protein (TIGR01720 family)
VSDVASLADVEERLLELWRTVLGDPEIEPDDDFFDIGGDSMVALRLAARARGAGLPVNATDVFEAPTVAELAEALRAREPAPAAIAGPAPTAPVEIPILPGQRVNLERLPVERIYHNNAALFDLAPGITPQAAAEALGDVVARHEALRTRFVRDDGEWRQVADPPGGELHLTVFDLSHLGVEEARAAAVEAGQAVRREVTLVAPLLTRAAFVRGPGGADQLVLVVHHLVCDGISGGIILDDLGAALAARARGEAPVLPDVPMPLSAWARRLETIAASDEVQRHLEHWRSRPWDEVAPVPAIAAADPERLTLEETFGAEAAEFVLRRLPALDVRAPELLAAAFGLAIAATVGGSAALVDVIEHGREEKLGGGVDLSRTVGFLSSPAPFVLAVPRDGDTAKMLAATVETMRQDGHRGVTFGLLRDLSDRGRRALGSCPRPQFSVNYLGRLSEVAMPRPSASLTLANESLGPVLDPSHHDPKIRLMVWVADDGCLCAQLEADTAFHPRDRLERLLERFGAELRKLIRVG